MISLSAPPRPAVAMAFATGASRRSGLVRTVPAALMTSGAPAVFGALVFAGGLRATKSFGIGRAT